MSRWSLTIPWLWFNITALSFAPVLVAGLLRASSSSSDWPSTPQDSVERWIPRDPTDCVIRTPFGPVVRSRDGPIQGVAQKNFYVFKSLPYAEAPARFEAPRAKAPWGPAILKAIEFGPSCIGGGFQEYESEDCLQTNIWVPKQEKPLRGMPVIVYIHGGMNQHGGGHQDIRQGDALVQMHNYPVIFVNFDFRLGILGWINAKESLGIPKNLGFLDQQILLKWVQRQIPHFGGDPEKVSLWGTSEGADAILAHLVSPNSAGCFSRAVMMSPPASDIWDHSPTSGAKRTKMVINQVSCGTSKNLTKCLLSKPADKLWKADLVMNSLGEKLSMHWLDQVKKLATRFTLVDKFNVRKFVKKGLAWHVVEDGDNVPGSPERLISEGRWSKIPVLMTSVKNEAANIPFPSLVAKSFLSLNSSKVEKRYKKELKKELAKFGEVMNSSDVFPSLISDRIWFCSIRKLAGEMYRTGGSPHVGLFMHGPSLDSYARSILRSKKCPQGDVCHAMDVEYVINPKVEQALPPAEADLARQYREEILAFVSQKKSSWVPFNNATEPMTLYDLGGPTVAEQYKRDLCDMLTKY